MGVQKKPQNSQKQQPTSTGQKNNSDSFEREGQIERKILDNNPFMIITDNVKLVHYAVIGKFRVPYETKWVDYNNKKTTLKKKKLAFEELKNQLYQFDWTTVTYLINFMLEHFDEVKKNRNAIKTKRNLKNTK